MENENETIFFQGIEYEIIKHTKFNENKESKFDLIIGKDHQGNYKTIRYSPELPLLMNQLEKLAEQDFYDSETYLHIWKYDKNTKFVEVKTEDKILYRIPFNCINKKTINKLIKFINNSTKSNKYFAHKFQFIKYISQF